MKTSDISVLIQGSIDDILTDKCIKSVKKFLPDSEIIISTWKDQKTSLELSQYQGEVEVLYLKDPGKLNINYLDNVNRQVF